MVTRKRRGSGGASATKPASRKVARPGGAYSSPPCFAHEVDPQPVAAGTVDVRSKRIYEQRESSDGYRVLVDRLWPRGMKKSAAALDAWAKDLAPSTELRKWFGHDPQRWQQFRARYRAELESRAALLDSLRQRAAHQRVTLLYSAQDQRLNQAVVLAELLREPR